MKHELIKQNVESGPAITRIAVLCWLIPVSTVIVCATWSMQSGLAPVCLPLVEGCLSISAACRSEPVIYFFRLMMLPMSVILIWFWTLNNEVLTHSIPKQQKLRRSVLLLSVAGSLFLILYVLYLGTEAPVYEFLRRIGIYVFFGGTGIAQLLTTFATRSVALPVANGTQHTLSGLLVWRIQFVVVVFMLIAGPLNLILKEMIVDSHRLENVIEWNFGLVMFCWYGLHALVCRAITSKTTQSSN